ncbi:MAG TPA: DNA-3-methyladenine glycosylase [Anaerolinea thermolimosa]|uniref:Putative 3-methyladenine DNA glycosylase n=1 Tax=Anaerolinea thermolimosa TaxID=229919 RepID=A0A3D1JJ06_9CHLR|nr:DNA-3-methyladenine glycosylase [Anaerolinea thermolimosa]
MLSPLPASFYERNTVEVARALLGMRLVRWYRQTRLCGIIVEAEAYRGEEDQACHARSGYTSRTRVMYGPPGHAYVYFTYGMHWMLNVVTEREGFPAAVLIRAVEVVEGHSLVAERRAGVPPHHWADGPAKLCQAFAIDGSLNSADLTNPESGLWIEPGTPFADSIILSGPRVGIDRVPEPWRSMPWRFRVDAHRGHPFETSMV